MAPMTEWLDDGKGFRCKGCGAVGPYDPPEGFYLLKWYAAGQTFDAAHKDCRAAEADGDGEGER